MTPRRALHIFLTGGSNLFFGIYRIASNKITQAYLLFSVCMALVLASTPITQAWAAFETDLAMRAQPLNRLIVKYHDAHMSTQTRGALSKGILQTIREKTGITTLRHKHWMANSAQLIDLSIPPQKKSGFGICNEQCIRRVITLLRADPRVEYVERDRILFPAALPNDPLLNEQWHYAGMPGSIRADMAWAQAYPEGFDGASRLEPVTVAVIDTGSRPHRDLVANTLPGYDFISVPAIAGDNDGRDPDPTDIGDFTVPGECSPLWPGSNSSWHGTHVMGTIGASTHNGLDGAGVAPNARLVPIRTLGRCGGALADIIDGIIWAAGGTIAGVPVNENPARVINLSLGGPGICTRAMQSAIDFANDAGAFVVVAAGNSATRTALFSPANCRGAFPVAAVNADGKRARYSNYGHLIKLAAPGGNGPNLMPPDAGIISTTDAGQQAPLEDSIGSLIGTSMAAPHVAGVAAMILGARPDWTPHQVEQALIRSARRFSARCRLCGFGLLDAANALQIALPPVD